MLLFLKNLLFTVVAPGTVGVLLPWLIASRTSGEGGAAHHWLAAPPLLAGAAIYLWCLWDFATFGRGTPAPIDAPKRLVVRGLYRTVRNPMYVGVLCLVLGWAVWFASARLLLYAAAVGLAFHLFVVLYEEPTLARLFGDEYRRYCERVERWLPRPPRRA